MINLWHKFTGYCGVAVLLIGSVIEHIGEMLSKGDV